MPAKTVMTSLFVSLAVMAACASLNAWSADAEVLRPRVPVDQRDAAKATSNPLSPSAELLEKGKTLYQGKAFCIACHGRDGKGLGTDLALKVRCPATLLMSCGRTPGPTENCSGS